jgi:hypothetical protein
MCMQVTILQHLSFQHEATIAVETAASLRANPEPGGRRAYTRSPCGGGHESRGKLAT